MDWSTGVEVNLKKAADDEEIMAASPVCDVPAVGTRLTLSDPDLYHRLMKECSEEERSIAGSVAAAAPYVAPSFVTEYLKQNDVRPLKKVFNLLFVLKHRFFEADSNPFHFQRSQKFPHAQYYCRLCDYHCDTLTICISHIKDQRHSRLARMQGCNLGTIHSYVFLVSVLPVHKLGK